MKPTNTLTPTLLLAAAASILVATDQLHAAQDVSEFARTTSPLTSVQKQQLGTFISRGTRGLASEDPKSVMLARDELIEALTRHGTSPVFREAFGETFVADARSIFESGSLFSTHNAYRVLAFIRTGDSNEFLAKELSPESSQDAADRVFASSMLALSLRTTDPSLIRPRQYNAIIRSIVTGAKQEDSWVVLLHEFESLVAVGSNPDVPDDIRVSAIRSQSEVLKATIKRIGDQNPATTPTPTKMISLARAVSPIVLALRTEFISLEGPIRRTFTESMLPSLIAVITGGERAWNSLHAEMQASRTYGDAIFQATVLARLVAGANRAPSSDPAQAWREGQRERFNEVSREWMQLANP